MLNKKDPSKAYILNPDVSENILKSFYDKVTVYLLQLFEPSFPCISSLA